MSKPPSSRRVAALALCVGCAVSGCALVSTPSAPPGPGAAENRSAPRSAAVPERSPKSPSPEKPDADRGDGKQVGKQVGKASFYADKFAGRKMADGTRMDPADNNAAHKTLPLGTTARVTNLETGRSAVITIQDRGPFVKGRIVDLSPATAREIGLSREDGLAQVEVTPLSIPQPDEGRDERKR